MAQGSPESSPGSIKLHKDATLGKLPVLKHVCSNMSHRKKHTGKQSLRKAAEDVQRMLTSGKPTGSTLLGFCTNCTDLHGPCDKPNPKPQRKRVCAGKSIFEGFLQSLGAKLCEAHIIIRSASTGYPTRC